MSFATASHRWPARRTICYSLAILLPVLSTYATDHVAALQHIPFALYFLAAILVAALGGVWPSLLAVLMAILLSKGLLIAEHKPWTFQSTDFLRYGVLIVAVVMISFISSSMRRTEEELRAALIALQERSDDLVASLSSSKCACWALDLDTEERARWFSGSYPVFGRPFSEIESLTSMELLMPEEQALLPALVERMKTTDEPVVFEHRVLWPDGELHWLEMQANRVAGPGCKWRGVTVDITERKRSEDALLRSEKLAAMGRLASTVAHEINNPLEAVTNLLYLARTDETISAATQEYLATAERELGRLSNITRLTLGFVRTNGNIADTGITEIVDDVLYLFQHRMEAKNISVERHYEPGVTVRMAPHELRQIATNLIANATDAVGTAGGRISVDVRLETDGNGTRKSVLSVEDNGSGIEDDLLARIFEPFFSTKEEVGTGIGLWVTKELVEKSGGQVSVTSHVADGDAGTHGMTRFRVEFPFAA